jgi:hypothetical protein
MHVYINGIQTIEVVRIRPLLAVLKILSTRDVLQQLTQGAESPPEFRYRSLSLEDFNVSPEVLQPLPIYSTDIIPLSEKPYCKSGPRVRTVPRKSDLFGAPTSGKT